MAARFAFCLVGPGRSLSPALGLDIVALGSYSGHGRSGFHAHKGTPSALQAMHGGASVAAIAGIGSAARLEGVAAVATRLSAFSPHTADPPSVWGYCFTDTCRTAKNGGVRARV